MLHEKHPKPCSFDNALFVFPSLRNQLSFLHISVASISYHVRDKNPLLSLLEVIKRNTAVDVFTYFPFAYCFPYHQPLMLIHDVEPKV